MIHFIFSEPNSVDGQLASSPAVVKTVAVVSRLVIHRLHWESSFSSGSCFLNTVKYEVLESTVFVILILICSVFFEQYEIV
jgi:hypothetical protein